MGFSVTASGIIVMAVLIISVLSMVSVIMKGYGMITSSIERKALSSVRSSLSITYITNVTVNQNNLTMTFIFSNNGSWSFWDFDHFDFILIYTSNKTNSESSKVLVYGRDWNITAILINGGLVERFNGVVDPSESGIVYASLPPDISFSQPITIVFVNQYGFKASYTFYSGV
ncbi:hypothetical protein [Fervidicoccus fontis]|uniref:Archaeal flagellar protein FlaF, putative n=2 Tax=Fervidicoccus fontis TaxID=683846 RepID=I0A1Q8_FERFK|nr:hypothetical protein [Fervidicoccus fontis]AFH42915.1 archaeal flagellar protein FlaF, putative [Fervidicoccus fontis Kam940]PMB77198.1 MAG: hypothetical protein C0177_03960 [Fervidicoccus fontis]HEW63593.1 hypothetical protein [Fervidicoccus fontis]